MPYALVEDMYNSLTLEKQKEVYDFLCFLLSSNKKAHASSPKESYHKGFFELFGSNPDFPSTPEDMPPVLNAEELF